MKSATKLIALCAAFALLLAACSGGSIKGKGGTPLKATSFSYDFSLAYADRPGLTVLNDSWRVGTNAAA
ncbi:MAG: hypothetical protein FWF49_00895, partial [Oscillospiraceae bacterium]|nr:hypothetical protein [Oscillospiraceae bacterium]